MDKNKKLFPQRLWELIHDPTYNFCLRWSPDGQQVYLNRNDFEIHYLKTPNNQFHTQKAISFVRQMNMYGFRKVDDCFYENDNFKRNCPHLLKNMIRRQSNRNMFSNTISPSISPEHNHHHQPSNYQIPLGCLDSQTSTSATTSTNPAVMVSPRFIPLYQNRPSIGLDLDRQQQQQNLANCTGPFIGVQGLLSSKTSSGVTRNPSSLDNNSLFGAAMVAALNSSNQNVNCSPLASPSLYLRLAALNSAQAQASMNESNNSLSNNIDINSQASNLSNMVEQYGSLDNNSLFGAAIVAALNLSNQHVNCSPLASSLYLRLAALNSAQAQASTNESNNNLNNNHDINSQPFNLSNMVQKPQY